MAARRAKGKGRPASAGKSEPSAAENLDHREFVSEAEEILERMFEDLSEFHEQRHGSGEVDPDLVNRVFRSAHSLKGLAGMFGMDAISSLAHHLEDILDGLRLGRISMGSPVIGLLDEGLALLATVMTHVESGQGTSAEDSAAAQTFVDQIERAIHEPEVAPTDELESLGIDPSLLRALTEYEEHRLRENIRRGRSLVLVDSTFEIAAFEDGLADIASALREVGEVVSTLPSPGDAPDSQIRFSLLVATDMGLDPLCARLDFPNTDIRLVGAPETPPAEAAGPDAGPGEGADRRASVAASNPEMPEPVEDGGAGESVEPGQRAEISESESFRSISETVRVDIRKLDELMNLVGELAIQRDAVGEVAARLTADPTTVRIGAELAKTHGLLSRKVKDLQEGVLDVRMVPLRQVFEKLSRVARRLRRDLDKEVTLDFSGADTELDKFIVEHLIDPLVHVVRNAFDHAIESAEERTESGKDVEGTISVRAIQRGNHVVIEIEDDGRGLDPTAIRAVAEARGLLSEGDEPSRRELLNLIFEPGFSTCEEVSATSGRGVGMDVVRTNLAEMGGTVELASAEGRGTTVMITLPITLAIMQALIVGVGEERYAIPLGSVLETMVVEPHEVGHSEGREILNLRGEPLLLRRLSDEFEIPSLGRDDRQFVVVLGMGEQRLGLFVDRLEGQQDAVIKPIKGPMQQIRGIAGATELGNRGAILVIDVSALVSDAGRRREAA